MSQVSLTETVSCDDGRRRWRAAVEGVLGSVGVTTGGRGDVSARSRTTQVGFVRVSDLEADTGGVHRTRAHIAEDTEPFAVFGVQERGTSVLTQAGRTVTAGPGTLFLWDASAPYTLEHPTAFATRIVRLPRRVLAAGDTRAQAGGAVVPTTAGLGLALRALLDTLVTAEGPRSASIADLSAEGVANLFCALVAERERMSGTGRADTATDDPRRQLLARIRAHIDDHLADPELSPGTVAQAHHISVRYLHRLFEAEGVTVARYIRRRRLERCARELARRSVSPPTVSSIAQRWGFVSPAHFSRMFRAVHGHSPVEWRALRTSASLDAAALGDGPET
ncbi:helix-turn-helix domain-containing protein [Streptomyces sp. NPDC048590]|uniref:helix-turn-helix domain-containing protein n=1 Tax=Streptomyces sp. NPDC048590 TaxID=3365574 RepID=UPI003723FFC8